MKTWQEQTRERETELTAFCLGFYERLLCEFGRTWDDNQDMNEAYDRGMNFAEELFNA